MSDLDRVTRILERHLSPIHARSVLLQALAESKVQYTTFMMVDLAKINGALERGLRLFTSKEVSAQAMRDISRLFAVKSVVMEPSIVPITLEADISHARIAARRMCESTDVSGFQLQKVTTIVSELARNIVSYTKGGRVELRWSNRPRRSITIRAIDSGPGIDNLAHVLSGNYKSKTGLGRGLTGTRRLADEFDVETGSTGTTVTAEVYV